MQLAALRLLRIDGREVRRAMANLPDGMQVLRRLNVEEVHVVHG